MGAIRGLTILQPWAWYIARGPKRIENRTWKPPSWLIGGYLAIHAGKQLKAETVDGARLFVQRFLSEDQRNTIADTKLRDLPLGAVVAVARLRGFVTGNDPGQWLVGPIGWQLDDVTPIDPVPCRGAQGLWPLAPDVLDTVRERYRKARP